jgi:signal transduction histidine kinase
VLRALLLFFLCWQAATGVQAQEPVLLTTCAAVRALSESQAALSLPVRVKAVVTLVPSDSPGRLTVDDGTGIWVAAPPSSEAETSVGQARVGDVVEIEGHTHEGRFAPTITIARLRIVGRAKLPPARHLAYLGSESGLHDSQRVTISGIVQSAASLPRGNHSELKLLVSTPTGPFTFVLSDDSPFAATNLIDSAVSLTGVFRAYFNSRRQFLGVRIYTNDPSDLQIVHPAGADAFASPELSLAEATAFSAQGSDGHRRRVRGTVTLCKPGQYFYLQADKQGLRINTHQTAGLEPGDFVEATGFFQLQRNRAEMTEALFRRLDHGEPVQPVEITRQQALVSEPRTNAPPTQDFDDFLVALRGTLVSVDRKLGEPIRLNLESDGVLVPAEFSEPPDPKFLASLQPGSVLWVTGVCDLIYSETLPVVNWPIPIGLRLLLRGPSDVEVITIASWWTLARLETALGIAAGVVLIFLAWVSLLRRQVTLRSTQLADEMRARRDATVEFATTLRERNRLAADLHDTTEQSLTGLAFQLEATGALQNKAPERSQHHLALARQLLNRSREDLRRSIWNLRATDLESKTLAEALQEVAANRSEDLAVRIGVTCEGPEHALPESVAGNLLLFAQEGITNALKHARPTQIDLQLRFTDGFVSLTVRDDGVGFEPASADGPKDGHFGLQGMRERMKRLGGVLKIESSRGQGTLITATVRSEIPRFSPTAG